MPTRPVPSTASGTEMSTSRESLLTFWHEATPEARRALVAASLGWMLDSFDVMLYALVLVSLMADLGMDKTTAGQLGSLTLVASAVGELGSAKSRVWQATNARSDRPIKSGITRVASFARPDWLFFIMANAPLLMDQILKDQTRD